jgi:hypothetical protein
MTFNRKKTLEELENEFWDDPKYESNLAIKCHQLRKVPIKNLSIENLRMLIGQKIGLKYLVPVALEYLEKDPLSEGDMYKGDLLANLALVDEKYWEHYPELNNRMVEIKNELSIHAEIINTELLPALSKFNYK